MASGPPGPLPPAGRIGAALPATGTFAGVPPLLALLLSLAAPPGDPREGGTASAPASGWSEGLEVLAGPWGGAGVVWDVRAHTVLTALHLVERAPEDRIEVVVPGRGPVHARIVDREPALDLALLAVEAELDGGPAPGASTSLAAGDPVLVARCGRHGAPARAQVLAASRSFAGSVYLALEANVAPGWSGRPVLDARGALVGIVDLELLREPGTALAVPIERAVARFPHGEPAGARRPRG